MDRGAFLFVFSPLLFPHYRPPYWDHFQLVVFPLCTTRSLSSAHISCTGNTIYSIVAAQNLQTQHAGPAEAPVWNIRLLLYHSMSMLPNYTDPNIARTQGASNLIFASVLWLIHDRTKCLIFILNPCYVTCASLTKEKLAAAPLVHISALWFWQTPDHDPVTGDEPFPPALPSFLMSLH